MKRKSHKFLCFQLIDQCGAKVIQNSAVGVSQPFLEPAFWPLLRAETIHSDLVVAFRNEVFQNEQEVGFTPV